MERFNYQTLAAIQGQAVTIKDGAGNTAALVVTEIKKSALDGTDWEAFSVLYSAPPSLRIPDGSYLIGHPCFGELELYLSPKSATEYESVITRKRVPLADETH